MPRTKQTRRKRTAKDAALDEVASDVPEESDSQSVQSSDAEDLTVHHRYPDEALSDLILRMMVDGTTHDYHVHKQNMASACGLIRDRVSQAGAEAQPPLVIELPFVGTRWLKHVELFVGFCYNQHDDILLALATAPTAKHFATLIYKPQAAIPYAAGPNGLLAATLMVVQYHTDDGRVHLRDNAANAEMTIQPDTTRLRPHCLNFDTVPPHAISLTSQLGVALYLQHAGFVQLLTAILHKLVDRGTIDLVMHVALVIDSVQASQQQSISTLRTACIDRLKYCRWSASECDRLSQLSKSFLTALLLATSQLALVPPLLPPPPQYDAIPR